MLQLTYLLFCFQGVWIYLVHKRCLCADIVVTFVFHKAHISVVCGLYKGINIGKLAKLADMLLDWLKFIQHLHDTKLKQTR